MAPRDPEHARRVGARIRQFRKARYWSQPDLEEKSGVDQGTISEYERGRREPLIYNLVRLAKAFKIPLERLVARDFDETTKRVFLIAPAFKEEWQVELEFRLLLAMRQNGLSCTILVASEGFDWRSHRELQTEVLIDREDYLGGVVLVPAVGATARDRELIAFGRELGKPVVFVDENPRTQADRMPENVCFVCVHDKEGGELAAKAVLELPEANAIKKVLVIASNAKVERFNAFKREIERLSPQIAITVSTDGEFNRQKTAIVARRYLLDALKAKKPFDVVYCTAESITLGCVDAIAEIDSWGAAEKPRVIGYDGVVVTKRMADSGRIARIVVQESREIAHISVEQLIKMQEGEQSERIVWIPPYLYPRRA